MTSLITDPLKTDKVAEKKSILIKCKYSIGTLISL